jgi:hypothetical protein
MSEYVAGNQLRCCMSGTAAALDLDALWVAAGLETAQVQQLLKLLKHPHHVSCVHY